MKNGDTKYYYVKQVKKDGHIIGTLTLIGRIHGYYVQLHYFYKPGYAIDAQFYSMDKAETYFRKACSYLNIEF